MVTDATGNLTDTIRLEDKASKGSSGGVVYMSRRLVDALSELQKSQNATRGPIITSERTRAPTSSIDHLRFKRRLASPLGKTGRFLKYQIEIHRTDSGARAQLYLGEIPLDEERIIRAGRYD